MCLLLLVGLCPLLPLAVAGKLLLLRSAEVFALAIAKRPIDRCGRWQLQNIYIQ
jgi:hypothetical protein